MATQVLLPQRGMGMSEATIVHWHKAEGDRIEEGELLLEIESSKATQEITAPVGGVISRILYSAGEEVEVGAVLAIIAAPDEVGAMAPAQIEAVVKGEEMLVPAVSRVRHQPPTSIRRITAQRMWESLQSTAQLTLHTEVDVTATVARREALKVDTGLTYTDILVKVVAGVLKNHPHLNATWNAEGLWLLDDVHIGVAVALNEGLVVPVVRDADQKPLMEIHAEVIRLVEKARSGKLAADELSGATFTISNLGMHRVDTFTPILNPPEIAILGVGRIVRKPAVWEDKITVRSMLGLSLTFDHRAIDGTTAAAFLDEVCIALEEARF